MKTAKNTKAKTSAASESKKHDHETERLTKDDLKALRTNVKAGIPYRCCEYGRY